MQPRLLVDCGWPSDSDRAPCLEFMRLQEVDMSGFWATPEFYRSAPSAKHRRRFVNDRDWYGGKFFNEFFRACHIDETLLVTHQSGGEWHFLHVQKGLGEPGFELRQERLLRMFLWEFIRLLGNKLATAEAPSVSDLSPRQREVMICLMEGDSEKQVALRLGISRHTVHDHVKRLHVRFGAASRGELLSRCRPFAPVLQKLEDQGVRYSSGKFNE